MWRRIFYESIFKPDPQVFLFSANVEMWKIESDLLEMGQDSKYCNESQVLALQNVKSSEAKHIFHVFVVAPWEHRVIPARHFKARYRKMDDPGPKDTTTPPLHLLCKWFLLAK